MNPCGYLIALNDGFTGKTGKAYDYCMAGNGLFIMASNQFIQALFQIAPAEVRGLRLLENGFRLHFGKIPAAILYDALDYFRGDIFRERYAAVTWDNGYRLRIPEQKGSEASCEYETMPDTVVDLHSHGTMPAQFSGTDDKDDLGFKLYGVAGKLDKNPVLKFRLGVYGYFQEIKAAEIFDLPDYEEEDVHAELE